VTVTVPAPVSVPVTGTVPGSVSVTVPVPGSVSVTVPMPVSVSVSVSVRGGDCGRDREGRARGRTAGPKKSPASRGWLAAGKRQRGHTLPNRFHLW